MKLNSLPPTASRPSWPLTPEPSTIVNRLRMITYNEGMVTYDERIMNETYDKNRIKSLYVICRMMIMRFSRMIL